MAYKVLVINDGSVDKTAGIVKSSEFVIIKVN